MNSSPLKRTPPAKIFGSLPEDSAVRVRLKHAHHVEPAVTNYLSAFIDRWRLIGGTELGQD
jgi:hypothetical protein